MIPRFCRQLNPTESVLPARIASLGWFLGRSTGWVLKDKSASHRYTFPAGFSLIATLPLRVHTGCGTETAAYLYWCSGSAVWNNGGDIAFLVDDRGNIVSHYTY